MIPMRLTALVFLLLPALAFAQPAQDQTGVANAFGQFVSAAYSEGVETTTDLIACPIEIRGERPAIGLCDRVLAPHRVRVERLTTQATMLFPSEPTALNPHYAVEEERDGVFHLLLFTDLDSADYVLAAFMDVEGAYRLVNLDTEGGPEEMPPPASVIQALNDLLAVASTPGTTIEEFARFIVARGDEEDRRWRAAADAAREDELRFVESVLESIRFLMEASRGDYEIEGYESDEESEGEWHMLHVRFDTHEMEERRSFAFLPIGGTFLLGDIDN